MNILHLTLKKKWFDMISSGEKKEEYREIKEYWGKRILSFNPNYQLLYYRNTAPGVRFLEFDKIVFKNGYSKGCPVMEIECKAIRVDEGKPEWGAEPGKKYFVIELGEILN